jgi:hypothetical protein
VDCATRTLNSERDDATELIATESRDRVADAFRPRENCIRRRPLESLTAMALLVFALGHMLRR